tara:strand:- start:11459 stop:12547 length:1089 start_codon:yes stop_codon:yes gene_type:complete
MLRYDNIDNIKLTKTPEGYLEGYAITTRTGVFKYMKADGSIQRELRLDDEVFKDDAINSFKLLPITDDHPQEEVNADNAKELAIGFTGEDIKRQDSYLLTKLKITDKKAIDAINSGKRGLSYGYKVNLVKKDGIHNGERYDYVQTNIKGNHLAIVYQGRAGDKARLRLDGQEAICVFDNNFNNNDLTMKKIRLDGKDYEVSEEVCSRLNTLETDNSSLKDTKKDLQNKVDSLQGERDALKGKVDELSNRDDSEEIAVKVKQRISLEKKASEFLKEDEDLSGLSDKDIKTKVIVAFSPEFKADEKSDEYINARFDAVIDIKKDVNLGKNMKIAGSKKDSKDFEVALSNEDLQRDLLKRSNNSK